MTTNALPYHITTNSITIEVDNVPHVIPKDHLNYQKIRDAIRDREWDAIRPLLDVQKTFNDYAQGVVEIRDGIVYYQGYPQHNSVAVKILEMHTEGFDIKPLANFLDRVLQNPLITAREELFDFCDANGFMIDENGFIVAYKGIRDNYTDKYTGTMDNSVGQIVEMPRHEVDPNRQRTCSVGLHFATHEYAEGYYGTRSGGRLMVLRVDPADVIAIPSDYNNQKGRACRYQVVAEIPTGKPLKPQAVYRDEDLGLAPDHDAYDWVRNWLGEDENYCDGCGDPIAPDEEYCGFCLDDQALTERLDRGEAEDIRDALRHNLGNVEATARDIGLTPRSLRRRFVKYGIDPNHFRS